MPVSNSNSHNYQLRRKYRINNIQQDGAGFSAESIEIGKYFVGNILNPNDCVLGYVTKKDMVDNLNILETEIAERMAEIKFLAKRIRWMDYTGVQEFDEQEYKIHSTIEKVIGDEISLSRNKMTKIASRIKCELEEFKYGDTVIVGKNKLWIIDVDKYSEMATLSGIKGDKVFYKNFLLESTKMVLTEKNNPIFSDKPMGQQSLGFFGHIIPVFSGTTRY